MPKVIRLFMWGYQPHFRFFFEYRATEVLKQIAPTLVPKALLVGIRVPEVSGGFAVCVEPEDGEWNPEIFVRCAQAMENIYQNHPDQDLFYGDAPSMRDKPENI